MVDESESTSSHRVFGERLTLSDRVGLFAVAAILGAFAASMFWIIHEFLNGQGWGDFILRLIIGNLILAIALFAFWLAIYALFLPKWIDRLIVKSADKLHFGIGVVFVSFALISAFFVMILPLLLHFGILK